MTNTERYLSTLSQTARRIYAEAEHHGRVACSLTSPTYELFLGSAHSYAAHAAHHATGLPPHVLSALAEAIRSDQRA